MKTIRIVVSVILCALLGIGWFTCISGLTTNLSEYSEYVAQGDANFNDGLFQKAIASYGGALEIRSDKEVFDKWVNSNKSAFADGVITGEEYATALEQACSKYPSQPEYWEYLLNYYIDASDYNSAHTAYNRMRRAHVDSPDLDELGKKIEYSYSEKSKLYTSVSRNKDGYYTVCDENNWGVIDPLGKYLFDCNYKYVSPVSSACDLMLVSEDSTRVIDKDNIVQSILDESFSEVKAVSEEIIPVKQSSEWKYYDYENKQFILDSYEDVSAFSDGMAAVKKNGKWIIISKDGDQVSDNEFDDIKLYDNGEYTLDGIMIASVDGKYGAYSAKGELKSDFGAIDADVSYGGYIAVKTSDKLWGYVDISGKEIIEPSFSEAKSFSNGLAAFLENGKWGYINEHGEKVIDNQYLDALYFSKNGTTLVSSYKDQYNMIVLRFP